MRQHLEEKGEPYIVKEPHVSFKLLEQGERVVQTFRQYAPKKETHS